MMMARKVRENMFFTVPLESLGSLKAHWWSFFADLPGRESNLGCRDRILALNHITIPDSLHS